jgi:hypothetical protein
VVWRDLLERAGGFPDVRTMSDRLLVRRLEAQGAHCHFVPELSVLHRNSKGLRVAIREAWRAGLLDDTPQKTAPVTRLATGAQEAITGPHVVAALVQTAAALLNVGLDGVYLTGRAWGQRHRAGLPAPDRAAPPESGRAS